MACRKKRLTRVEVEKCEFNGQQLRFVTGRTRDKAGSRKLARLVAGPSGDEAQLLSVELAFLNFHTRKSLFAAGHFLLFCFAPFGPSPLGDFPGSPASQRPFPRRALRRIQSAEVARNS